LFEQFWVSPEQQARLGCEQAPSTPPLHGRVPFCPQLLLHACGPQHALVVTEQAWSAPLVHARLPVSPQLFVHGSAMQH
jgi:hypothetical protein